KVFTKLLVVERWLWPNSRLVESPRFGHRVRVKGWVPDISAARPKANTAYFVRIGFSRDGISARSFRRPATRESGNCKVKASPEEMHRTGLSYKTRPELVEDRIY